MKKISHKVVSILIPFIFILITSLLSNVYSFNFMSYKHLPNRYVFIVTSLILLIYLFIKRSNIYTKSLDIIYIYKLHILSIIIWIFLFFYYKLFYISFIVIIFNLIILILVINNFIKLSKISIFYLVYLFWYLYIIIINFIVMLS